MSLLGVGDAGEGLALRRLFCVHHTEQHLLDLLGQLGPTFFDGLGLLEVLETDLELELLELILSDDLLDLALHGRHELLLLLELFIGRGELGVLTREEFIL